MPMLSRKPSPPPDPEQEQEPQTVAEVERNLAALDRHRAEINEALALLPNRETQLLQIDAADDAFEKLDAEERHLRRELAKADLIEQDLLRAARTLRAAEREQQWHGLVARYRAASEPLIGGMRELMRLHCIVAGISSEASAAGFTLGFQSLLPPPPALVDPHAPDLHAESVRLVAERAPPPPPSEGPVLAQVRFLKGWDRWNADDRAGFPAGTAHALVAGGFAEWASRIPPRPTSPPEAHEPARVRMRPVP